jgi:uncharacterized protein YllA (UPF0747 family)
MLPISEIELKKVNDAFKHKKLEGCSELKAAYLATSEAGYTEIIKTKNNSALFYKKADDTFMVLFSKKETVMIPKEIVSINFTTDTNVFDIKEGE